jgi:hypothetical protein
MKRFMITYIIFSIIFLVLVYVITFIQETQKRSTELFYEISREAKASRNFDEFVKYQSVYYRFFERLETNHFDVIIYDVIGQNGNEFFQEMLFIVLPNQEVNYANSLKDEADQTSAVFKNLDNGNIILDTKFHQAYQKNAISYGIEILGFYYYSILINQSFDLEISFIDYDGNIIIEETILTNTHTLTPNLVPFGFIEGYTKDEVEIMLDMNTYLLTPMMINIALFLGIDIAIGGVLYIFLKKKKL